jgi:hypothetical protein
MHDYEENLKTDSSDPEQFRIQTKASRTSQQGRLYRYLKDQGRSEKRELTKKAINAFYLVDALEECGTRSREDIQKVAKRCIDDLLTQVDRIQRKAGLRIQTNVTPLQPIEEDSVELDESDRDEETEKPLKGDIDRSKIDDVDPDEEGLTDEQVEEFFNSFT